MNLINIALTLVLLCVKLLIAVFLMTFIVAFTLIPFLSPSPFQEILDMLWFETPNTPQEISENLKHDPYEEYNTFRLDE